jgi:hypothetical protein
VSERSSMRLRILTEGAVIVGSILLAFAIQAAWEESQETQRVEQALTNLEAGLTASLPLVAGQVQRLESRRAVLQEFLMSSPAALSGVSADSVREVIGEIFRPRVSGLNSEEVLGLLDDPALTSLTAPGYRGSTAEWRAQWRNVRDRQESLLQHQDEAVRALARHPSTRTAIPGYEGVAPIPNDALATARADEDIVVLVASKLWYWSLLIEMYPRLAEDAERILTVIHASGEN